MAYSVGEAGVREISACHCWWCRPFGEMSFNVDAHVFKTQGLIHLVRRIWDFLRCAAGPVSTVTIDEVESALGQQATNSRRLHAGSTPSSEK